MLKELSFNKRAPRTASPEDLAALESKLGVLFPPAFTEFCSRWNGGFPSEENEFYPVPPSFKEFFEEYGPQADGVLAHIMLGATEEFSQCSLLRKYSLINYESNLGIIPITVDLMGNQVVLRTDDPGGIVYWRDHELWEMPDNPQPGPQFPDRPRLFPIAPDLEYFYNSLTSDPDK